jgi:coenzyme F420-dependent glucose-6-phosphate dehydrogenase
MINNSISAQDVGKACIGYWASQEQYSMQQLIEFVKEAEKGGIITTMTSDHFHPWWHDGGYGNFTWVWLATAAERTKRMQFVTGVTATVYRYNPGIIAQAFASLDVLHPGRISLGVGSGEAMNEVPLGFDWPDTKVRLARTVEAIQIIKKLWKEGRKGENGFVDFNGKYFSIRNAKLYTPPHSDNIPLYMAAVGPEAIKTAAKYCDGLITVTKADQSREILDLFNKSAEDVGKDPFSLEKIAKPKICYSTDYDKAFKYIEFWRATLLEDVFNTDISDPRELEENAKKEVSDEQLKKSTPIITSIEDCIQLIEDHFKAGFTRVYIHSTSPEEMEFIKLFCNKVLPYLSETLEKNK